MCRGITDLKKVYQLRTSIVNDANVSWVADSHSILSSWRNHSSKLLNVHGFNDVRQREIHTAEALVPETSVFKFELVIEKFKSHKSSGID